jgi:hypothetical protein
LEFKMDPNDEVYKWRQQQTQNSIDQAAAARGMYNSRPTINALSDANMALQGAEVDRQFSQNYLSKQDQLKNLYEMAMGIGTKNYGKATDDYSRGYGQLADQFDMSSKLGATKYGQAVDQYGREYGRSMDQFNMSNQLGQVEYGKLLDAIKAGQGAAASMGQNAITTGGQLSSIYGNIGNAGASNALYRGQNEAQMWQGIGNAPMNALAMYNMFNKSGTGTPSSSSWMDNYNWSPNRN